MCASARDRVLGVFRDGIRSASQFQSRMFLIVGLWPNHVDAVLLPPPHPIKSSACPLMSPPRRRFPRSSSCRCPPPPRRSPSRSFGDVAATALHSQFSVPEPSLSRRCGTAPSLRVSTYGGGRPIRLLIQMSSYYFFSSKNKRISIQLFLLQSINRSIIILVPCNSCPCSALRRCRGTFLRDVRQTPPGEFACSTVQ